MAVLPAAPSDSPYMVTLAPGRKLPESSATYPRTVPVMLAWAWDGLTDASRNRAAASPHRAARIPRLFIPFLRQVAGGPTGAEPIPNPLTQDVCKRLEWYVYFVRPKCQDRGNIYAYLGRGRRARRRVVSLTRIRPAV